MDWLCEAIGERELTLYFMNGYNKTKETEDFIEFKVNPIKRIDRVRVSRSPLGFFVTFFEGNVERAFRGEVTFDDLVTVLENGTGLSFS